MSGCLGLSLETGKVISGGAAAEAELALTHLKNILLASNSNLTSVVKATLFITDLKDFQNINEVYKKCNIDTFLIIVWKENENMIFVFIFLF